MIYSFNRALGWASSGVEYAQCYRARLFGRLGWPARFVFTDFFPTENIEHYASNLGFLDEEVIWIYSYFTDYPTQPTTYRRESLEAGFGLSPIKVARHGGFLRYTFSRTFYLDAFLRKGTEDVIQRCDYVFQGHLTRRDFYTSGLLFSEHYVYVPSPEEGGEGKDVLSLRTFFNQDGTEALSEIMGEKGSLFRVRGEILDSKERFLEYFIRSLHLTEEDMVILDRSTDIGQAVLSAHGRAALGCVVHADHYSSDSPNPDHILWNNFYEYALTHAKDFSFFICSTKEQSELLSKHLEEETGSVGCQIVTIPVGSLDELSLPEGPRTPFSLCTCSRLAPEKHVDYLVEAVCEAREAVPEMTLDIYGTGSEEAALKELIAEKKAEGFVHLMGHRDLSGVYVKYSAYASASTSEGFGLTLMEAAGSGLPLVGFDVRYGNQAFIEDGGNGYLAYCPPESDRRERVKALADALVRLFTEADLDAFSSRSYEMAEPYLTIHVMQQWKSLREGL